MIFSTILLDLDDTLIVEEKSALESFSASAEYLNRLFDIDPGDFIAAARSSARELWYSLPTINYALEIGISSWEALWAEFSGDNDGQKELRKHKEYYQTEAWRNALLKYNIDDENLALKLSEIFKNERRQKHILFKDSMNFLIRINNEGFKTGLITNGTPDLQRQKINKSGIAKYFRSIAVSGELGYKKPGNEIFRHTINKLGSKAEESIMIGDSPESDIKGANEAGIASVWLNRNDRENKSGIVPEFTVNNLYDVFDIIK